MSYDIQSKALEILKGSEIDRLDCTMFDQQDYVNMILQRSEILYDVPKAGRVIAKWSEGDETVIQDLARAFGDQIAKRTIAFTLAEYEEPRLQKKLHEIKPKSVADIGCGYAFFDYFIYRDFSSLLLLIDIESSDARQFGFAEQGAAYTQLSKAREFLVKNKVPESQIRICNPQKDDLSQFKDIDLAVSLLSCGFHYPENTYEPFFNQSLSPNGHIILDRRWRSEGRLPDNYLIERVLFKRRKSDRISLVKGGAPK